jgi:hypothetical protein
MDKKQEQIMMTQLSKLFYKKLHLSLVVFTVSIIIISTLIALEIAKFFQLESFSILIIIYLLIIVSLIIAAIIDTKPYFKDLRYVKAREFLTIIGEVISYRRVVHGGDPDTINYYPTIRDIDKEWIQVEIKVDNTELNETYQCVYLPNTKLAVCEKVIK